MEEIGSRTQESESARQLKMPKGTSAQIYPCAIFKQMKMGISEKTNKQAASAPEIF